MTFKEWLQEKYPELDIDPLYMNFSSEELDILYEQYEEENGEVP